MPDTPTDRDLQILLDLVNKGIVLSQAGRVDEALAVFDELVHRFGKRPEAAFAQEVARALRHKGKRLERPFGRMKRRLRSTR